MPDIKAGLQGTMPSGDGNGLQSIAADMAKSPQDIRVGIVLFDAKKSIENFDDGSIEVKVRIRRFEVMRDKEDAKAMQRLLEREFERRTGQTTLPFDLEEDVRQAFDGFKDTEEEMIAEESRLAEQEAAEAAPSVPNAEFVEPTEDTADTGPTVPVRMESTGEIRNIPVDKDVIDHLERQFEEQQEPPKKKRTPRTPRAKNNTGEDETVLPLNPEEPTE